MPSAPNHPKQLDVDKRTDPFRDDNGGSSAIPTDTPNAATNLRANSHRLAIHRDAIEEAKRVAMGASPANHIFGQHEVPDVKTVGRSMIDNQSSALSTHANRTLVNPLRGGTKLMAAPLSPIARSGKPTYLPKRTRHQGGMSKHAVKAIQSLQPLSLERNAQPQRKVSSNPLRP